MQPILRLGTRGSPLALVQARLVATALRDAHGWGPELIEIEPIATSGDQHSRPAARRAGRQGAVDQGARPRPARGADRPRRPFDEGRRDDPAARDRDRRHASARRRPRPAGRSGEPRRASRRAHGSAPRRRGGRRNCWPGVPISRSSPSAAMSRPGCARSTSARSTRPCSPPPASSGSAGRTSARCSTISSRPRRRGRSAWRCAPATAGCRTLIGAIDDRATHACVAAERRLLEGLGGSCRSPVAALATIDGDEIRLRAEILTEDGRESQSGELRFASGDLQSPLTLARALLDRAAPRLRSLFEP